MSKRKYTYRYLCVLWVWFSHKAICINRYVAFYHYKRIHIVWNPIKCRTSSGYFGREVPPRLMPLEGLVGALIANRSWWYHRMTPHLTALHSWEFIPFLLKFQSWRKIDRRTAINSDKVKLRPLVSSNWSDTKPVVMNHPARDLIKLISWKLIGGLYNCILKGIKNIKTKRIIF